MSEAMAAATHLDFLSRRLLGEPRICVLGIVLHRGHVFTGGTVTILASNVWTEVLDLLPHDLTLRCVASNT